MKKIHLVGYFTLLFVYSSLFAQLQPAIQALKVGDKMPAIELGTVVNNHTGKKKFAEFSGKLIILDFWSTHCQPCMAAFPKLERLQTQFGDSIQIILVNSWETQDEIIKSGVYKRKIMPDLPSITEDKILKELFPSEWIGLTVWIDGNGIVRLIGNPAFNNNEEKIRDLLDGKPITYIIEGKQYNKNTDHPSLFNTSGIATNKPIYESSFFSFSRKYGLGGGSVENVIDSIAGTVRNSYVNQQVIDLYKNALSASLNNSKIIYSKGNSFLGNVLLYVKDTLLYTSHQIDPDKMTDTKYIKCRYCYEQIMPINIPIEKRKSYMLEDLNRYFGSLYGTEGSLKSIKEPVYVLVRSSDQDKIRSRSENAPITPYIKDGKKMLRYSHWSLRDVVSVIFYNSAGELFHTDSPVKRVLDETKYEGPVDMVLPDKSNIHNLEDIRKALQPYDLDIIQVDRELKTVEIKER